VNKRTVLIPYFNTISSKALDHRMFESELKELRKAKFYLNLPTENVRLRNLCFGDNCDIDLPAMINDDNVFVRAKGQLK